MGSTPAWIEILFKRIKAGNALHSAFLLNLTRDRIAEEARTHADGRKGLRAAALARLEEGDAEIIALALITLSAVGRTTDLAKVEPFGEHRSELVRRAFRACRFELKGKSRMRD
jgi:hypothetical protein